MKKKITSALIIVLCVLMAVPWCVFAQAVNAENSAEKTQQTTDAQTAIDTLSTPEAQPTVERPFDLVKPDKEEITAKIGEEVSFTFEINDPQATAEDTYTIAFKDEVAEGVTPFDADKIITEPKPITGKDKKVTVTIPAELTKDISEEEAHSLTYTVTKNDADAVTSETPVKITFKTDTDEPKKEEGNIAANGDPNVETEKSAPYVSYRTHVENIGWQNYVKNGATAGTTGRSLRLEAMTIKLGSQDVTGNIQYRTHIQNIGWESGWKQNGQGSGTSGQSLRLEAMQVRLTGKMAQKYDIYYRVHAQNFGWLKWAKNGASAGTAGFGYRLEGMQIVLVRKGQKLPSIKPASQDDRAYIVNGNENVHPKNLIAYQTHVENIGWQSYMVDGVIAGTSGLGYRLEAMRIKLNSPKYSGNIEYRTHIQNIGWESKWKKNGQTSGTSGKGLRLEAMQVRLTGTMAKKYDVYYRVHAQNFGWLGWAKNGASAGTEKFGYRLEAMQIVLVAKGKKLPSYSPASNRKEAFIKNNPVTPRAVLDTGYNVNRKLRSYSFLSGSRKVDRIVRSIKPAPSGATTTNLSISSVPVIAWYDYQYRTIYWYSKDAKPMLNADSSGLFRHFEDMTSLDLSYFDTSRVTNMRYMFENCEELTSLDCSRFNTSKVTDMSYMFHNCRCLRTLNVSRFNTSNLTDMRSMFSGCNSLITLDLSSFNTSKIFEMENVFWYCSSLRSLNISHFDTSRVTTMVHMFYGCSSLTSLDLSSFDTSKVRNMNSMFYSCDGLKTIYVSKKFVTTNVGNSYSMFLGCRSLVGGNGTQYHDHWITDGEYARIDRPGQPGYFTQK